MTKKSLFTLLLMCLPTYIGVTAQNSNARAWVPLSTYRHFMIFKDVPIFDIRVNLNSKQKTTQDVGVVFRNSEYSRFLYINTHEWKYNFNKKETYDQYKLSKGTKDNEGFKHPDLSSLGGNLMYLYDVNTNALLDNIQVLIDNGDFYYCSGKDEEAINIFRSNAEKGDAYSMYSLAYLIINNNPIEAFNWYKRAADSGNEEAKVGLAECYARGIGVEKNLTKAETMLLMCNTNLPSAKLLLETIRIEKTGSFNTDVICNLIKDNYQPAIRYAISFNRRFLNKNSSDIIDMTGKNYNLAYNLERCAKEFGLACFQALITCENALLLKEVFSSSIIPLASDHETAIFDMFHDAGTSRRFILIENDLNLVAKKLQFTAKKERLDMEDHLVKLLRSGQCDFLWCIFTYMDWFISQRNSMESSGPSPDCTGSRILAKTFGVYHEDTGAAWHSEERIILYYGLYMLHPPL